MANKRFELSNMISYLLIVVVILQGTTVTESRVLSEIMLQDFQNCSEGDRVDIQCTVNNDSYGIIWRINGEDRTFSELRAQNLTTRNEGRDLNFTCSQQFHHVILACRSIRGESGSYNKTIIVSPRPQPSISTAHSELTISAGNIDSSSFPLLIVALLTSLFVNQCKLSI